MLPGGSLRRTKSQPRRPLSSTFASSLLSPRQASIQRLTVILFSKEEFLCNLFYQYFNSYTNVSVVKDPWEIHETTVDCLVVPCPSGFGHPLGQAEKYFLQFGPVFQKSVRESIQSEFFGEQPPGTSFIVTLPPQNEDSPYVQFVAFVALSRTPSRLETSQDYAYNAFRGVFNSVLKHNLSGGQEIVTIAIPTFGLDGQSAEQQSLVVKQMALAYRNLYYPRNDLPSVEDAEILDKQICLSIKKNLSERLAEVTEELINGTLVKRGLHDEEELAFLIQHISGKDSDLAKKACECISILLHEKPSDFCLSRDIICSGLVKSHVAVQTLLRESLEGNLSVHLEIPLSEIELVEKIGDGTEASVFKGNWADHLVAVKRFRGIPARDQFIRELSIMSLCRHPNLVRCYGGQTTNEEECTIVTELMDDNLFDMLSNVHLSFPFPKVLYIALSVARGMEFLHSCHLIHRDLKSNNLLVRNISSLYAEIKICDFGLSRVVDKSRLMTGNVGTVSWIPPEIFEKKQYNEKCDVYSFGIILWELFYRKVPFSDISAFEIPIQVIEGRRPPLTKEIPKNYSKLMKLCWDRRPSRRPSFTHITKVLTKIQHLYPDTPFMSRRSLQRVSNRERSLSLGSVTRSPAMDRSTSSEMSSLSLSPAKGPKISMRMNLISTSTKASRKRLKDSGEDSSVSGCGSSGGRDSKEGKEGNLSTSNSKNG